MVRGQSAARWPLTTPMTPPTSPTPQASANGHHAEPVVSDTAPVDHASSDAISPNATSPSADWQIVQIPLAHIVPSPFQSREVFDEAELEELALSIKAYGVQQPVLVRLLESEDKPDGGKPNGQANAKGPRYELVTGERRWRASKLAGRKTVPALVRELSDLAAAEIAVIENVQRANLSIIEEARGYKRLAIQFRLKEERIAKKVGKSAATIKEMLRLLALPEGVQNLLARRQLSAAHGHELLRLSAHPAICEAVALRCISEKITASALAGNLLPNANELKRSGLITELGYATKFEWRSVCRECPHKALVTSGYTSYCLKPDEWRRKQAEAIEAHKQEATRVMQQAREQSGGTVETEQLKPGSYRYLSHVQLPAGCSESCPCRSRTCDASDPTEPIPICLNPPRFEELRDAERKANEELRQKRYSQDWKDAVEQLQDGAAGFALLTAFLAWPLLRGECRSYYTEPEKWRAFVQGIALQLEIELPWALVLEREMELNEGLKTLQSVEAPQLLLLCAALGLAQEAESAIRFASPTPQLDAVLGRQTPRQISFECDDEDVQQVPKVPEDVSAGDWDEAPFAEDYDPGDLDYPDELEE